MAAELKIKRGALSGLPSLAAGEPGFTTDQFRLYVGSMGGNQLLGLLHKINGTAAPGTGDDSSAGFSVGSVWVDTTNDKAYVCVDSTASAAIWKEVSNASTLAVDSGGTGRTSHTAYAVLCGGTTSTGAQQSIAGVGTSGQVLTSNGAGALPTFQTLPAGTVPNVVHNGGFEVWQRGTNSGSLADDTYYADRWYVLSQNSDSKVSRVTGTLGARYAANFDTNGASTRTGLAQIVEASDSIPYRGRSVRFQFKAKASASTAIRFAILEWTGTADSVTSDVVNNWASGTYTAGNFFLGSNLTVTAVSSGTATTSFGSFSATGTLGSSVNNLILFVWTENSTSDEVTVTECGLYDDTTLRDWLPRSVGEELAICQRYLFKRSDGRIGIALNGDNLYSNGVERFPVEMRAAPTVSGSSFSVNAGSAGTPSFSTVTQGFSVSNSANNWTASALVDLNGATFSAEL